MLVLVVIANKEFIAITFEISFFPAFQFSNECVSPLFWRVRPACNAIVFHFHAVHMFN